MLNIEDLLISELDYAFFVSGLSFLLIGICSIILSRSSEKRLAWHWLAAFAFTHTLYDWLELLIWVLGYSGDFSIIRSVLHSSSLLMLLEFNRRSIDRLVGKYISVWVYVAILLPPLSAALFLDTEAAIIFARYVFSGLVSLLTAWVSLRFAFEHSDKRRYILFMVAMTAFLFTLAAGIIVPADEFFPASVINEVWFQQTFLIPVQIARTLLALVMALAFWLYLDFFGKATHLYLAEYRQRRYLHITGGFLILLLLGGWYATDYLGKLYIDDLHKDAKSELSVISNRISGELRSVEGVTVSLSTLPEFIQALNDRELDLIALTNAMLVRMNKAVDASLTYILDINGVVIASSNYAEPNSLIGKNFHFRPYFRDALEGNNSHYFALGVVTGERGYYTGYPVKDGENIIGVLVIKKLMDFLEEDLKQYQYGFFTSPDGVIFLASNKQYLFSTLFPLSEKRKSEIRQSKQFGNGPYETLFQRPRLDGESLTYHDEKYIYTTQTAAHYGWKLTVLKPQRTSVVNRFFGIVITLLLSTLTLIFFAALYLELRSSALLSHNQKALEEANKKLTLLANTDILTNVYNRKRFNELLEKELQRTKRHKHQLSIIMFDIDHFKQINDTYGHQVGDEVLKRVASICKSGIRDIDYIARWGGEEFMILSPETGIEEAGQLAERVREQISLTDFGIKEKIYCSFGVTEFKDSDDIEPFIHRVDQALYQAKGAGRNCVVVINS